MPSVAFVLGGAACIWEDLKAAEALVPNPDQVVLVKDIWKIHARCDHFATFHCERIPSELPIRRQNGHPDPKVIWTLDNIRCPAVGIQVKQIRLRGGSSGLLGAYVGMINCSKVILCGIPMDAHMRHYHERKKGRPWKEGKLYQQHWHEKKHDLVDRVRSMNGWTKELLGAPTPEWLAQPIDPPLFDPKWLTQPR